MSAKQIVKEFVEAINNGDILLIERMLSEKHIFVDSDDTELYGKKRVLIAWKKYFEKFDTYTIKIDKYYIKEDTVVIIGEVSGFIRGEDKADKFWKIPAAWKALIEENKIKQWHTYADSKPIWDILSE
jgi:ketosteroid isomerase-like protein